MVFLIACKNNNETEKYLREFIAQTKTQFLRFDLDCYTDAPSKKEYIDVRFPYGAPALSSKFKVQGSKF